MGLQHSRLGEVDIASKDYTLQDLKAPRLVGFWLGAVARLARSLFGGPLVAKLKDRNGFRVVRDVAAAVEDAPVYYPLCIPSARDRARHEALAAAAPQPRGGLLAQLTGAYAAKRSSPSAVVEALLSACAEASELNAVRQLLPEEMRLAGAASTERYAAGRPLGPLDGVPVMVKDELAVRGCTRAQGTAFLTAVAESDCEPVRRLRAAGAIICGTTNMHELGLGTTGHNCTFGPTRNPWDPKRYPGGSSSGSAAALAAGLTAVALGTDAGGSIRIPASLCGVVGLKPSFARVPCESNLGWSTAAAGPMATTVEDVAAGYLAIAGESARVSPLSVLQPVHHVHGLYHTEDLHDLRIGVYRPYFEHCDPAVSNSCERMLAALEARGAKVVEVSLTHLGAFSKALLCTVLSEFATFMDVHWADHARDLAADTTINLAIGRSLTARDMLAAQKVRAFAMRQVKDIFQVVDVIVSPTTACTAPEMLPDAELRGESNLSTTSKLMRFNFLANLVGIPAGAVPIGVDDKGLPIGFQAMADHWNEHLVLRVMKSVEELCDPMPCPQRKWNVLV